MGKPEPASPPATLPDICRRGSLRMAFERVRENGGCRGADGVTLAEFEARLELEIDSLAASLERGRYHPFPLLVVQIPKPRGGVRRLAIPTVRDRVAQTAVFLAVREPFEREFEDSSYAYREGRSVKQAVRRVAELRDAGFRFPG